MHTRQRPAPVAAAAGREQGAAWLPGLQGLAEVHSPDFTSPCLIPFQKLGKSAHSYVAVVVNLQLVKRKEKRQTK